MLWVYSHYKCFNSFMGVFVRGSSETSKVAPRDERVNWFLVVGGPALNDTRSTSRVSLVMTHYLCDTSWWKIKMIILWQNQKKPLFATQHWLYRCHNMTSIDVIIWLLYTSLSDVYICHNLTSIDIIIWRLYTSHYYYDFQLWKS